ncbi:alkane oxidation protein activator PraB [Pseudomonas marginalis]|uniref:alkane oxidation protein activator PraB n=1 Tax=Pseudomonas marginalis TaxID=298 RepID=UPI0038B4669D
MQALIRCACKTVSMLVVVLISSVCMGATFSPVGPFGSITGTLTLKSPSSLQIPIKCDIRMSGQVSQDGTVSITNSVISGANTLCQYTRTGSTPWTLSATSLAGVTMSNVQFSIFGPGVIQSACGPSTLSAGWTGSFRQLNASSQVLSGSCTLISLEVLFWYLDIVP